MSPHAVRGTGTCYTVDTVERGRDRGWEENCLGNELPHYKIMQNASCTYVRHAKLQSTSTWNSDTCAYALRLLTSRGTQALFVVNSVKLHLTALKEYSKRYLSKLCHFGTCHDFTNLVRQCPEPRLLNLVSTAVAP